MKGSFALPSGVGNDMYGCVRQMKKGRVAGSKDDLFGSEPVKGRRYDAEGLPIYSTEELAIGKGANTKDCPFDCDCCF